MSQYPTQLEEAKLEPQGNRPVLDAVGPTSSAYNLYSPRDKATMDQGMYVAPASAVVDSHGAAVNNIFSQLDNHAISWFHIKTVIVAGMGFFCDSYDLFSISLVTKTIGRIYYPDTSYNCVPQQSLAPGTTSTAGYSSNCLKILTNLGIVTGSSFNVPAGYDASGAGWADSENNGIQGNGDPRGNPYIWSKVISHRPNGMPNNTNFALLAVALCGTLAGQLLFGYLGDRFGRRRVFGITLYIMITACAAQAFSFGSSSTAVIASLCFFRFCLGLGVGGDYPLSATLMSEYASKRNRGAMIAAVFAMQGFGYLTAAAVSIIFSAIWMRSDNTNNPDYLWRIILSFGCIPTALTLYARLSLPETPRYTMFVNQNATQLVEDMNFVLAAERARASGGSVPLPSSLSSPAPGTLPPPCGAADSQGELRRVFRSVLDDAGGHGLVLVPAGRGLLQPEPDSEHRVQ